MGSPRDRPVLRPRENAGLCPLGGWPGLLRSRGEGPGRKALGKQCRLGCPLGRGCVLGPRSRRWAGSCRPGVRPVRGAGAPCFGVGFHSCDVPFSRFFLRVTVLSRPKVHGAWSGVKEPCLCCFLGTLNASCLFFFLLILAHEFSSAKACGVSPDQRLNTSPALAGGFTEPPAEPGTHSECRSLLSGSQSHVSQKSSSGVWWEYFFLAPLDPAGFLLLLLFSVY